jgi:hypothetical protein
MIRRTLMVGAHAMAKANAGGANGFVMYAVVEVVPFAITGVIENRHWPRSQRSTHLAR